MTVEETTRQLGAAIQADARYKRFVEAQKSAQNDLEVVSYETKINDIRQQYSDESSKPDPNAAVLEGLDNQFQALYAQMMNCGAMGSYNIARQEMDDMMEFINQIIYMTVNGEDPATCQPKPKDDCGCGCGGECGDCGGGECGEDCCH